MTLIDFGSSTFCLVLPGSALADGELAGLAEQLGIMEEHSRSKSTQPTIRPVGPPCTLLITTLRNSVRTSYIWKVPRDVGRGLDIAGLALEAPEVVDEDGQHGVEQVHDLIAADFTDQSSPLAPFYWAPIQQVNLSLMTPQNKATKIIYGRQENSKSVVYLHRNCFQICVLAAFFGGKFWWPIFPIE